jgi:hypothetical protein
LGKVQEIYFFLFSFFFFGGFAASMTRFASKRFAVLRELFLRGRTGLFGMVLLYTISEKHQRAI